MAPSKVTLHRITKHWRVSVLKLPSFKSSGYRVKYRSRQGVRNTKAVEAAVSLQARQGGMGVVMFHWPSSPQITVVEATRLVLPCRPLGGIAIITIHIVIVITVK